MMMNLFSSFDPYGCFSFYVYFLSYFVMSGWMLIMWQNSWENTHSNWNTHSSYHEGFNSISGPSSGSSDTIKPFMVGSVGVSVSMCIFSAILSYNYLGLLPYTFTLTSSTAIILSLSLALFTPSMAYLLSGFKLHMFIPSGSPYVLVPFLFIIELVSTLIRPITLALRLSANITSGHILMHLCMGLMCTNPFMASIPAMLLMTLETLVCFIQAYVFMSLLSLYISETSN
uniref:ATP synthase subunit a n=1 Tax=Gordius sp. VVA-2019 TaxID=2586752 RepID=A0A514ABV1_9BILA|nr:ATP synthase F0 subunit 6 [Gordius sp. VVA-2019]